MKSLSPEHCRTRVLKTKVCLLYFPIDLTTINIFTVYLHKIIKSRGYT